MATYRGKEIDLSIPDGASEEAKTGLEWRKEHGRGGTEVGVASARTLAAGGEASPEFVRKVAKYFPRHEGDLDAEGAKPGEDGYPSAGLIAWKLWGGDAGRRWSEAKRDQLDRIDEEAKAMNDETMTGESVRKHYAVVVKAVGDRQVRVIASTATVDRSGDIVVAEGIGLARFKQNPVVLWMHNHEKPVARCVEIGVKAGKLEALVQFPPEGTSEKADEIYGLIKAGVVNATSIGFMPGEWSPMDPDRAYGPRKYISSELLEFSFVSVPANPDALIIERSLLGAEEQIALARKNLDAMKAQQNAAIEIDATAAIEVVKAVAEEVVAEVAASVEKAKKAPNYRQAPMCSNCGRGAGGGCSEYPMPMGDNPAMVCDGWQEMQIEEMSVDPAAEARKRLAAAKLRAAGIAA